MNESEARVGNPTRLPVMLEPGILGGSEAQVVNPMRLPVMLEPRILGGGEPRVVNPRPQHAGISVRCVSRHI